MSYKVHYLLRVALASIILLLVTSHRATNASNLNSLSIIKKLEHALNKKQITPLEAILPKQNALEIKNRYQAFLKKFPNAKWTITKSNLLKDGRISIKINITGEKKFNGSQYTFNYCTTCN